MECDNGWRIEELLLKRKPPLAANSVITSHPTLDSVVLNAGIQRAMDFARPETIDLAVISEELTTNYLAHVHLTVAFLPFLQSQQTPTSLIFTTSGLALLPLPPCANYSGSKAAMHALILVLREQLQSGRGSGEAPNNVKVIELLPPAVQTELHDEGHRPHSAGKPKIGMPLAEFAEQAWCGLEGGDEQIPIGMAKVCYDKFETARQEMLQDLLKTIRAAPKP
jgi:short-subunit dehydrogenase involved in D-alanine esterification of teichoic acids